MLSLPAWVTSKPASKALDQDLANPLTAGPELARKLANPTSTPGIGRTTAIVARLSVRHR